MMSKRKQMIFFVEGPEDMAFVEKILSRIFSDNSIDIISIIPYQQKNNGNIRHDVKHAKATGTDYVLLSDLDSHSYSCITSRKNKRVEEFYDRNTQEETFTLDEIIIVVEELESWILAGIDTSIGAYASLDIPENTDHITKEKFNEIISNSKFNKLDLINPSDYDVKLAIKRNKSFKYFLEKYHCL